MSLTGATMETGKRRARDEETREKYLIFRLGGNEYGVDIDRVREIIGLINITRVPGSPDYVSGVINLRGNVIPVLDLRQRLGCTVKEKFRNNCIMVTGFKFRGKQMMYAGILVDSVSEVVDIALDDIEPALSRELIHEGKLVEGLIRAAGRAVILLNLDAAANECDLVSLLKKDPRGKESEKIV